MKSLRAIGVASCLAAILVTPPVGRAEDAATFTAVMIKGHPAHPTRLLAKVKSARSAVAPATALAASGLHATHGYNLVPGLVVLDVDPSVQMMAAASTGVTDAAIRGALLQERIEILRESGLFEYVEPDYLHFADATPTDAAFVNGTLWGLRNTGQSGGAAGVDLDAVRAWDVTKGSTGVIVGVVDTGIRYTHQDLAAQMWHNPREVAGNGRDDDGNGYVDDVYGINAIANNGNPMDDDGHGTHVAGTIGAAANNGQPHVGVAWNVRLMALKFLPATAGGGTSDAIECINYAVANGAKILNNSWGGGPRSQALLEAILAARNQGVLFIAAAGNDGTDNDLLPHFPSSYDLDNIIAVAAIDRFGARASFSDYGRRSVDLGAPGVSIYSTVSAADAAYETHDGTSMAVPHVSGVAALVRAQFPGIPVADLRDRILNTTVATASLEGITTTGGRVNAYNALTAAGDGQLELKITPAEGTTLFHGRGTPVTVRITDLLGLKGATVTGTVSSGGTLTFLDNGGAPDLTADDSFYTATLSVPTTGTQLSLSVNASAPGKTGTSGIANYHVQPPPPNDNFADRVTLAFTNGSITANNFGGSLEPGEPLLAGENGGASLWWTWTAPANTSVTLSTEGSGFDTLLGVFTGDAVNALTEIASNDDISGPNQPSRVTFNAVAGATYQIAVDGWEGKAGSIVLKLNTAIPPVNDRFADRLVLTGASVSASISVANAAFESGEPADHQGFPRTGSVWWEWTAPTSGTATLTHTGGTLSAVYTGSSLPQLTLVPGRYSDEQGFYNSRYTFPVTVGTTYQIAVLATTNGVDVTTTIQLTIDPAPANDHFANRTPLVGASTIANGSNVLATRERGEPRANEGAVGASLWWTWTAPAAGTVVLDSYGSTFITVLAVYTGESLATLLPVASTPSDAHRLAFPTAAGVTYQIALDGYSTSVGDVTLRVALVDTPANDMFARRSAITGAQNVVAGNTAGATLEPGEPSHAYGTEGTTVWWTWQAPSTGTAIVSTTVNVPGETGAFVVSVYTGSTLASLARALDSEEYYAYPEHGYVFHAIAGTSYQIAVDRDFGSTGAFLLKFSLQDCPPNDMFADRIVLSGSPVVEPASNAYATRELGEPGHGLSPPGARSVWWTWTAPANGKTRLAIAGEGAWHYDIIVYSGSTLSGLTQVAYRSPNVDFVATAGAVYQIVVFGSGAGFSGSFKLNLFMGDSPSNDLFSRAASIVGATAAATGTNRGATLEELEYYHGGSISNASVWWNWTAPASGRAVVTTAGSDFNTLLGVYTGSVVSTGLTSVQPNRSNVFGRNTQVVSFDAVAGTTYRIAVDGYQRDLGDIVLNVTSGASPPNDRFADRIVMTGATAVLHGTNLTASPEPDEPYNGFEAANASVWWSWTAPASGRVAVLTAGSNFDTMLAAYTGTAVNRLTRVAGNQDDPRGGTTSRINFAATAGATYHFVVDGYAGAMGEVTLSLAMGVLPTGSIQMDAGSFTAGSAVTLTAVTAGGESMTYQWLRNGEAVAGATTKSLSFPSVQAFHAGSYSVRIENDFGSATTHPVSLNVSLAPPSEARLTNLSTRAIALTGDNVLIPGFIVEGPGAKKLLLRAVGPTLGVAPFNLGGVLPNPRLALKRFNGSGYDNVVANDDWAGNANVAAIRATAAQLFAFPLVENSADAALLVDLAPGQYSVVVDDAGGQTGIAIVELYDADDPSVAGSTSRLINISNRGFVGTGDIIMIPGFVVSEEGPKTLLIRVVGPTLANYSVPGLLTDPTLSIYRHNSALKTDELILTNDDWSAGPGAGLTAQVAQQVSAFALPSGSKDAAFVVTLNPGIYSVHARGANGTTGVALVEVYAVP